MVNGMYGVCSEGSPAMWLPILRCEWSGVLSVAVEDRGRVDRQV